MSSVDSDVQVAADVIGKHGSQGLHRLIIELNNREDLKESIAWLNDCIRELRGIQRKSRISFCGQYRCPYLARVIVNGIALCEEHAGCFQELDLARDV